ncbi:hypothetical protein [Oceanobacillus kimchii]|uniref:hypothetical protein n=1 Tax=Oceanobacillus kimchii TaxID=746691 RepID=UPI003B011250
MSNVAELKPWEVWEFSWGSAMKHHSGRWEKAFLKPSGQEIDLSKLDVILHDNGIEFY